MHRLKGGLPLFLSRLKLPPCFYNNTHRSATYFPTYIIVQPEKNLNRVLTSKLTNFTNYIKSSLNIITLTADLTNDIH